MPSFVEAALRAFGLRHHRPRWSTQITTATVLLIRHAAHGQLGQVLSGRTPGLPLSEAGQAQAKALGAALAGEGIAAVQSSPVQRAQETAQAIAEAAGCSVETVDALDEVDFGEWTGTSFARLDADPRWARWNSLRSLAEAPGGEGMAAAQRRALDHLTNTAARYTDRTVAMVSHCDIIRAIIAGVLGLSLDNMLRFDIGPASVSRLAVGDWGAQVQALNLGIGGSAA